MRRHEAIFWPSHSGVPHVGQIQQRIVTSPKGVIRAGFVRGSCGVSQAEQQVPRTHRLVHTALRSLRGRAQHLALLRSQKGGHIL